MSRTIRMVPENWEHPKQDNGRYRPMMNDNYKTVLAEWITANDLWDKGQHPDQLSGRADLSEYKNYAEWAGNPPDVEYYVPYNPDDKSLCTMMQLYEETSEGTPISPKFKTVEEVARYAADNCTVFANIKAPYEKWLSMLNDDFVHHTDGNITFI